MCVLSFQVLHLYLFNGCPINRPNGVTFNAGPGTSEFTKRFQPKEGDIVSFKHRGFLLGSKKPKNPVLYRLRSEIQWDDVVQNFKDNTSKATGKDLSLLPFIFHLFTLFIVASPMRRSNGATKPKGYWLDDQNEKKLFIDFAATMGFDPFVAENWKRITYWQVKAHVRIFFHPA